MIENPPKRLYVIGNKEILNQDGIAIIGSRNCSKEGLRNARLFAVNIAMAGFNIISGMAKGIDTASHFRSNRSGRKDNCCFRMWHKIYLPS